MDIVPEIYEFDRQFEQVGWSILTVPDGGEHYFSKPHASVKLSPDLTGKGNRYFVYDPVKVEHKVVLFREQNPLDHNLETNGWHELDASVEKAVLYRLLPNSSKKD